MASGYKKYDGNYEYRRLNDYERENYNLTVDTNSLNTLNQEMNKLISLSNQPGQKLDEGMKKAVETAKLLSQILEKTYSSNTGVINAGKFSEELKKNNTDIFKIRDGLKSMGDAGKASFNELSRGILSSNVQLKQASAFTENLARSFKNAAFYFASSGVLQGGLGKIKEAVTYMEKLDDSLNEIRIVSGMSADEMSRMAEEANKTAKALGKSTLDYTNAALIYAQQGLNKDEIKERTEITLKMSNVLGENAQKVSDYMTAIWNNFADGSQTLESFGDKLAKLGAETASSAEEIAKGMQKFASVGETVGLSYDYAASALATIVATTRESEDTVGTALRTMFSRIQDLELGNTLEDGTTLGKYSEALDKIGVSIKDQNGELKNMDSILDEMGLKWKSLTKDQQVAAAQNIAGTREYSKLMALMNNWDFMQENVERAGDAIGTLNKQQEIYSQSTEAHLNILKARWEDLFSSSIDTKGLNSVVDALGSMVDVIDHMLESFGDFRVALLGVGSIIANMFSQQIGTSIGKRKWESQKRIENARQIGLKKETIEAQRAEIAQAKSTPTTTTPTTPTTFNYKQTSSKPNEYVTPNIKDEVNKIEEETAQQTEILEKSIENSNKEAEISERIVKAREEVFQEIDKYNKEEAEIFSLYQRYKQ